MPIKRSPNRLLVFPVNAPQRPPVSITGCMMTHRPRPAKMAKAPYFTWATAEWSSSPPFTGGGLEDHRSKCGHYFFEWTGNRLRQVKFIPGKRTDRP